MACTTIRGLLCVLFWHSVDECEQVHTLDGDDRKNGAEDAQDQTCRPGVKMLELMSNVCVLEAL